MRVVRATWISVQSLILAVVILGQDAKQSFYIEDRFEIEAPITASVVTALRKDEIVIRCIDRYRKRGLATEPVEAWFSATQIDLNSDPYPDLIVEAKRGLKTESGAYGHCLYPASRQWYWLLWNDKGVFRRVLRTTTFYLDIQDAQTKGLSNVITNWCTANTCVRTEFRFNGKAYELAERCERPNKVWN